MNYLAHAYLSFNEPEILVGNMISDFVKGNKKFDYSSGIQKGIQLHRAIDQFTDDHPSTKAAKLYFKPAYRLYAGAFVDVVYDHFLANDINEFHSADSLADFAIQVYYILQSNFFHLPQRFQNLLPYMKSQNWLFNYQYRYGIEKSFGGLVKRAIYLHESATAFAVFNDKYDELKKCYNEFFHDQKEFSSLQLRNLLTN
jgi:acyl carrier protein phosphodiesterase